MFEGSRVSANHGRVDPLGHVQEQDEASKGQEANEEQVLDRGLPRGKTVLSLGHGPRRIPEHRSSQFR